MRSTFISLTALPVLTNALATTSWSFENVPSSGLTDITFPINLANTPHTAGYYFAQQFGFTGISDVGYTGLQPQADGSTAVIRALFSSFVSGTTTSDSNCSGGADGSSEGVSCSIEIQAVYADTYNLVVQNIGGDTWEGSVADSTNGYSFHIGTWTLPSGSGGIQSSEVGFIEYYPWNSDPSLTCADLPATQGTFYDPITYSSTVGAEYGSLTGGDDNCQSQITISNISGGVQFSIAS